MLFERVKPKISSSIENGFKELLENRHLYQNLYIQPPDIEIVIGELKDILAGSSPPFGDTQEISTEYVHSSFLEIEWIVKNPFGRRSAGGYVTPTANSDIKIVSIEFEPKTVKLFCTNCKRIEAYSFQQGKDLLKDLRGPELFTDPINEQIFSVTYQCQSCKSLPEVFLVRRKKDKISLHGRSPIEFVVTPSFLPKEQRKYFSDSIVAFNSGQTLAGIFLLRTFIEQFVRSISKDPLTQNKDSLFSEYAESLPKEFKQHFPSLGKIYDQLSSDIHGATGSEELYNQMKFDIEKHFDAKRLFEL
jgi:hypothetical protein